MTWRSVILNNLIFFLFLFLNLEEYLELNILPQKNIFFLQKWHQHTVLYLSALYHPYLLNTGKRLFPFKVQREEKLLKR